MRDTGPSRACLLIMSMAARTPQASAQEAGAAASDETEIVVTATRREERLIDVPQSVTARSGDDLAKLAATQFRDFANTVPGLVFQTAGAGNTQISMRGVTAGVDVSSTVGVYVDEVPYGSSTTFARSGRYTPDRSEEHTSELQSLMRISYAVFCLKKKHNNKTKYK